MTVIVTLHVIHMYVCVCVCVSPEQAEPALQANRPEGRGAREGGPAVLRHP